MRKLMLTLVLFGAALTAMAATPSKANAWWGRWGAGYCGQAIMAIRERIAPITATRATRSYAPAYSSYYYAPAYGELLFSLLRQFLLHSRLQQLLLHASYSGYYAPSYSSYYTPAYSSYYYPGVYMWP